MSNIDPKILELAKREYGEKCELVKRTEWSYTFKCGPLTRQPPSAAVLEQLKTFDDPFSAEVPLFLG